MPVLGGMGKFPLVCSHLRLATLVGAQYSGVWESGDTSLPMLGPAEPCRDTEVWEGEEL